MRSPRTFVVLLLSGALATTAGACVVEEGTGEDPTPTSEIVPNESPGEADTPNPGSPDDGGGTQDDPGAGVGGGQTND